MAQSNSATINLIKLMRKKLNTSSNVDYFEPETISSLIEVKDDNLTCSIESKQDFMAEGVKNYCKSSKICGTLSNTEIDEKVNNIFDEIKKRNAEINCPYQPVERKVNTVDISLLPLNKAEEYINKIKKEPDNTQEIITKLQKESDEVIRTKLKDSDYVHPDELNHDPVYVAIYNYNKVFGFHQFVNLQTLIKIINECELDKQFDEFMVKEEIIRLKLAGVIQEKESTYRCYPKNFNSKKK